MKPLWKVRGFFNRTSSKVSDVSIVRFTWVLVVKDKSNHLVVDSLRSVPQERCFWTALSGKANDWRKREHVSVCAVLRMSKWWNLKQAWINVRHDSFKVAKLCLLPSPSSRRLSSHLFHLLSSLSLSPLCLCLSPCDVALVLCLVCMCVCVCLCVCWERRGGNRVYVQNALRVSFWMYTRRRSLSQILVLSRFFSVPQLTHTH